MYAPARWYCILVLTTSSGCRGLLMSCSVLRASGRGWNLHRERGDQPTGAPEQEATSRVEPSCSTLFVNIDLG